MKNRYRYLVVWGIGIILFTASFVTWYYMLNPPKNKEFSKKRISFYNQDAGITNLDLIIEVSSNYNDVPISEKEKWVTSIFFLVRNNMTIELSTDINWMWSDGSEYVTEISDNRYNVSCLESDKQGPSNSVILIGLAQNLVTRPSADIYAFRVELYASSDSTNLEANATLRHNFNYNNINWINKNKQIEYTNGITEEGFDWITISGFKVTDYNLMEVVLQYSINGSRFRLNFSWFFIAIVVEFPLFGLFKFFGWLNDKMKDMNSKDNKKVTNKNPKKTRIKNKKPPTKNQN